MTDLGYGQQRPMEDASMVGTLRAQAEMIWPLERPRLEALGLRAAGALADLGCGTGEFAGRVARAWPDLCVFGLDRFDGHLAVARATYPAGDHMNLAFVQGDARRTPFDDGRFDVVTVRHVLQAIPDVAEVLSEAWRILAPGGLLYVLAEDYAGLLFDTEDEAARRLFLEADPVLREHGTHLLRGRAAYRELREAGFADVSVAPLLVDTTNASRETFARMLAHWRDGYVDFLADAMGLEPAEVARRFDALRLSVLDEDRYACWLLFSVTGRRPL